MVDALARARADLEIDPAKELSSRAYASFRLQAPTPQSFLIETQSRVRPIIARQLTNEK